MLHRLRPVLIAIPAMLLLSLGACSSSKPAIFRQPPPPQIVAACPPAALQQAEWVAKNLPRVRLNTSKPDVIAILGQPARTERVLLTDNRQNPLLAEILFYHTGASACADSAPNDSRGARTADGLHLLPLVFQQGRLQGYGLSYYHDAIVPRMRPLSVSNQAEGTESLGRGNPLN